jgi:crotonobetainyl-CoA:carnitine CoA-transferase CaiB-like acyl-CoA transferase
VTLSRTPAEVRTHAPGWGEHTDAVLSELGYSGAEIAQFKAQGVV